MTREDGLGIRPAERGDCAALLELMRELALFEGYATEFHVTLIELEERLFTRQDFHVLVADSGGALAGMLVYYYLPFTYDLRPWAYMKELFVAAPFRRRQVGTGLLRAFARECLRHGASRIRFAVLADNDDAKLFYEKSGAEGEACWQLFSFGQHAITELAKCLNEMSGTNGTAE